MSKDMNTNDESNEYPDPIFDHLAAAMDGESDLALRYRKDLCLILAGKIKSEFGLEGLCEMLSSIDATAGWITDILLESSDIDDILFKNYGIFKENSLELAKKTRAMEKFHKSMWLMRKRYAKLMASEIYEMSANKKSL